MIDGHNTTVEWQQFDGDTVVLPVGSFEQHGEHLPLATDALQAGHLGHAIAERLGGALLPTLTFATSLEHTGFRGTISLRPETLMQVIRDIAAEVQRQHFHFLIVVNHHGGNHALVPVIRDWNRDDHPLKIILVSAYEFRDPEFARDGTWQPDIHAGEFETSVMLALHPELVRWPPIDPAPRPEEAQPLAQKDLTMVGMGQLSESGVVGTPSVATAAKGEALLKQMVDGVIPYLEDRMARLRRNPRYVGRSGTALRAMTSADVEAGMRLKAYAGWNQTEDDWRFFAAANVGGCFVAAHNGKVVGSVTTINYNNALSWIGMVLVDPEYRRQGIATRLMKQAMAALDDQGCRVQGLDATAAGREVYAHLGFDDGIMISRLVQTQVASGVAPEAPTVRAATTADLAALVALDAETFGVSRESVIRYFLETHPHLAWVSVDNDTVSGFCLGRPGSRCHQIGPLSARSDDAARALLATALRAVSGAPVLIDVPEAQSQLIDDLIARGFCEERVFCRMLRNGPGPTGTAHQQYAVSGPELG
jgi:creatinine amidohydrolase